VSILTLTAHDDEINGIVGLEVGSDDYVTEP
jgi:DNA-binding response OmpR family regulator